MTTILKRENAVIREARQTAPNHHITVMELLADGVKKNDV